MSSHETESVKQRLEAIERRLSDLHDERRELIAEMRSLGKAPTPEHDKPTRHGMPWSDQERQQVAELFSAGRSLQDIALWQERTAGSIMGELVRQGLIIKPAAEGAPAAASPLPPCVKMPPPPVPRPATTGEFERAFDLLENSRRNLFLTGKAGTGKSTFLRYFKEHTKKKIAIVAPTGIAALNVGAQTIHSFFRFKPTLIDRKALKPVNRRVMKALELLIIDEISMVRADIFDAIDHSLKIARKNNEPFGGVQICVIGDLFQLPPVINREDKAYFSERYDSPFFFSTESYQRANFTMIQFTTIHRQNDGAFIQILNAIRSGVCDAIELEALNSRLNRKAVPAPGTLMLTTTNSLAETINHEKLARIASKEQTYHGELDGEFGMNGARLPAPMELALKIGAQVMFVKNDPEGRWVNGTIGTVCGLSNDQIRVMVGDEDLVVVPEVWKALGYELDKEKGDIAEKTLGSYCQFPLMLAWAITIHKSQGKTLERVIIDLGDGAFAPGQLYVALSRCKSLTGIALKQPVTASDIRCDPQVVEFMRELEEEGVSQRRNAYA
jgi:ATP-dependent DNA helicase PIF1